MEYILVGIGGIFGSMARFALGRLIYRIVKAKIPLPTFIINISGALALGVLVGADVNKNAYFLLAEGFLGAYTTFSTFMFEGFSLIGNKRRLVAFCYVAASLVIGILGFISGLELARLLMHV